MIFVNAPIPPEHEERKKSAVIMDYIVRLGALLIPILTYLSQNTLRWWGSLAIAIYVLVVAVFLVGPVLAGGLKSWTVRSTRARLEKTFFPRVVNGISRFKPFVDSRREDHLWSVWRNAASSSETQKHIRPAYSHFKDTLNKSTEWAVVR